MADHAAPEYTAATGNDYNEHKGTYQLFVKLAVVSTVALCNFMIAFAIGGVNGQWTLFTIGTLVTIGAAIVGLASKDGKPGLQLGLLALLTLVLIVTT